MIEAFSITGLWQPFSFTFMLQAFAIVTCVAIPTAILSCFLVLKGWSLMGDAISHSVLPGVVLAYVTGISFLVGAFAAGIFCAVCTGFLKRNSRLKEDTLMGVVFSSMFALGMVLMAKIETEVHLDHILFGDILGIGWRDVFDAGLITALVLGVLFYKGRDIVVFIFDPQHAKAIGLPVSIIHYGLLCLLSLTIVGALKAVGMIFVIALLITPGATALLLTAEFRSMVALSIGISVVCSLIGVYLSFFIDSAPAPTIIILMTIVFICVFCFNSFKGDANLGSS